MALFIVVSVVTWLGALSVWWAWSRGSQRADVSRLKARLVGGVEAAPKAGRRGPALMQGEAGGTGQFISGLLKRLELTKRLRIYIEQAGLKWDGVRTVHGSLALLLIGFTVTWYVAPAFRAFEEQNLGLPLDVALEKMAERVPLLDVHFFVSAVLLQKRTGGNLAELLDKLAYLIRERFKLRGRIKAISAHGRMTGMVLSAIPAGVGVIMFYVNPYYAQFFLQDETGRLMLGAAIGLQFVGYGIIHKIISIEV